MLLEHDTLALPIVERLARAAQRVDTGGGGGHDGFGGSYVLRPDKTRVAADLAHFVLDVATRPNPRDAIQHSSAPADVFGRVILPPRTGKTLVAAHMIAGCGLCTTFIVPTRALVDQVATELESRLPGVPIGVYFSDRKALVDHGVNITTYSILLREHSRASVPLPIARSALNNLRWSLDVACREDASKFTLTTDRRTSQPFARSPSPH